MKVEELIGTKKQFKLSPKFGRQVLEVQMLLLSKQVAWKGEELNNLYDYIFKKYNECLAEIITCPEDKESEEFLFIMIEHVDQVLYDDLSFLSCYMWYKEILGID